MNRAFLLVVCSLVLGCAGESYKYEDCILEHVTAGMSHKAVDEVCIACRTLENEHDVAADSLWARKINSLVGESWGERSMASLWSKKAIEYDSQAFSNGAEDRSAAADSLDLLVATMKRSCGETGRALLKANPEPWKMRDNPW